MYRLSYIHRGLFVITLALPYAVRAETAANSFVVTTAAGVRAADDGRFHLSSTSPVEVTVEARPGWRVDGRKSVTFTHVPGRANVLRLTSAQGEDDEHVRYEDCWWPSTVTNKHISAPVISAESDEHKLALYAVPSNGATFSVDASVTLVATGVHENVTIWQPCPVCGSVRSPSSESNGFESRVPCGYDWLTEGLGWSFDTATWSAQVKKGSGDIEFFVVGRNDCADCVCEDLASTPVDIVELSVQRPNYLGLDRTDAGRSNSVSCLGAAVLDAGDLGAAAYQWTECGICEFDGRTGDASVTYRNADADLASESLGAEHLTVSVELEDADGCTASATCATNFTVVKVDVKVNDKGEEDDESKQILVPCFVRNIYGGYSDRAKKALKECVLKVECKPGDLPPQESVTLAFDDGEVVCDSFLSYEAAAHEYTIEALEGVGKFYLAGVNAGDKEVLSVHLDSKAKDKVCYRAYACRFTAYADGYEISQEGIAEGSSGSFDTFGHAFWMFEIDADHLDLISAELRQYVNRPMGFYPGESGLFNVRGEIEYEDIGGKVHYDNVKSGKSRTTQHTWCITLDDCLAGMSAVAANANATYDLQNCNCTDMVIAIGRAAGVAVPDMMVLQTTVANELTWLEYLRRLFFGTSMWYSNPLLLWVDLKYLNFLKGEIE